MRFLAELNEEKICKNLLQTSGEVDMTNMVEIDGFDTSVLGKRWDGENWHEVPVEVETEVQETAETE